MTRYFETNLCWPGRACLPFVSLSQHLFRLCLFFLLRISFIRENSSLHAGMQTINNVSENKISGGIRMELVPMKAMMAPGTVVNFVCAYFSTERLEIDLQVVGRSSSVITTSNSTKMMMSMGPPVRDSLDRFPWGSRRVLSLVADADHRQVKCRVTNDQGLMMGELTALIQPAGFLSAEHEDALKNVSVCPSLIFFSRNQIRSKIRGLYASYKYICVLYIYIAERFCLSVCPSHLYVPVMFVCCLFS